MILPAGRLANDLVYPGEPVIEAVATDGTGVFETLKSVIKQVLLDLKNR